MNLIFKLCDLAGNKELLKQYKQLDPSVFRAHRNKALPEMNIIDGVAKGLNENFDDLLDARLVKPGKADNSIWQVHETSSDNVFSGVLSNDETVFESNR